MLAASDQYRPSTGPMLAASDQYRPSTGPMLAAENTEKDLLGDPS